MSLPPSPLVRPVAALYRAWHSTLRLRGLLPDGTEVAPRSYPFGREVFAFREGDALALGGLCALAGFTLLVAKGRDGDRATALLEALGGRVVRGATRRGGESALRELVTLLADAPGPAGLVVDGPLGPAGVAKGGAVLLGWRTGRPVRAVGVAASTTKVFRGTWSALHLPAPFATVAIALEPPLPPDPRATGPGASRRALEEATGELTRRLAVARERARALLRGEAGPSPAVAEPPPASAIAEPSP